LIGRLVSTIITLNFLLPVDIEEKYDKMFFDIQDDWRWNTYFWEFLHSKLLL
jgi:hypothetical protein